MKEVIHIDNDLHLFTSRRINSKIIISKVFFCNNREKIILIILINKKAMEYYYDAYNYIDQAEKDLEVEGK